MDENSNRKKLLVNFAVWVSQRYGFPVDEKMVEHEIEIFLKSVEEGKDDETPPPKARLDDIQFFFEDEQEEDDVNYVG